MKRIKTSLMTSMTMAIVLLLGLQNPTLAATAPPSNSELKIGMIQEFENLNPLIMSMMATTYIYKMVNRNLVTIDTKGNWVPMIVKRIPKLENGGAKRIKENGVDKIRADWEILANAKWGDGTPVTGHDVKFAWRAALSPTVSVGEKEVYDQIERIDVDAKNPKKFSFVYKKAKWDFWQLGTFYILPRHLEEKIFEKFKNEKEGYEKNSLYSKNPSHPGLYNGPYRIKEIKLGSHLTLVPNPTFYGKAPEIQKIVIKLIPNTGTLEANLRSGTVDMISVLGFTFDQALSFEKKVKSQSLPYNTNFKQSLVYEHIDLNLANAKLKDVRVRKALVFAINRDKLTKALFEGRQKKAIHNVAPIDPWYTEKVVKYPTSKRKAKKLLDAAGWKLGKDGIRYKNGEKLSLVIMTTSGNKTRELVEVFLQKEWKSVGVDVQIKNEPPRVYFGETVRKGKYPAMAMYAWISSPENTPRSTFHSSSIPTKDNGYSGQNSGKWKNAKVDKLIEQIDVEFNANKRKKLAGKILHHYTNEVPVIPLYYRSDVSVTPKNLKNYELSGHQFSSTNFIENWTLN